MDGTTVSRGGRDVLVQYLVVAAAGALAFVSARPYAGSWNDGSRLATVEALIDQHTWAIDHSIFVEVPAARDGGPPLPYPADEPVLLARGTYDKLLIGGHYYSDKSPVPALWLAGCYRAWQWATGWTARQHTDRFCRDMTLASSGLAYVLAVLCIYRMARRLRLPLPLRLALTASFALATVALTYVEHVNNHILLLAVTAALVLGLVGQTRRSAGRLRLLGLGTLAGLAYTIDLGVGPVLLLCTSLLVLARCIVPQEGRRPAAGPSPCQLVTLSPCLLFALAVLPWLVLHHAINYAVGGSFKPANANPEYFLWPECPFSPQNLTGSWAHQNVGRFAVYAAAMLVGKRGFLGHNLPLFLVLPALVVLLRRRGGPWREVLWAAGCCAGTWLLYAATSNNSSGRCCSIRWFVPLLAPAYYVLALVLARRPQYEAGFLVLTAWGAVLVLLMREGPWMKHMVPLYWPLQAAALASWALCHRLEKYLTQRRQDAQGERQAVPVYLRTAGTRAWS